MVDELQHAIDFIKSGDKRAGRQLLARVLRTQPRNEAAWLWMSGVVASDEQRRDCLERVLAINPENQMAKRGLAGLRLKQKDKAKPIETVEPSPSPPAVTSKTREPPLPVIEPTEAAGKPKRALTTWQRVLIACMAILVYGIAGTAAYLALAPMFRPARQATRPTMAATLAPSATDTSQPTLGPTWTSTPTKTPAPTRTRAFRPGAPTATPPGEDIADPNYVQGKAAYQAENYPTVLRLMTYVIESNPDLAPAYWYRGMAYFNTGNYPAMLAEMEEALKLDPKYALGYADRGVAYLGLGDKRRAMADWGKALSLDPSLAKVHHNIAVTYYNQGDYSRAMSEYDLALAIDPNRAHTWSDRAGTSFKLGRFQDCIDNATKTIELESDIWICYHHRGTCQASLGQYTSAIRDFDKYIDAVPGDPRGWYDRGLAYHLSGLGNNQQALDDYTRAIQLDPTFTWALINRGIVYTNLKEYGLALADHNAALALGEIPAAYMGQGDAYWGLAKYDESVEAYEKSLAKNYGKSKG